VCEREIEAETDLLKKEWQRDRGIDTQSTAYLKGRGQRESRR